MPVRIGAIEVAAAGRWRWAQALELRDVRLLDRDGRREALRLPRVRVAVSPSALLPEGPKRWRPLFEQVLIDGAELEVRRDAGGRLWIAGLEVGGGPEGESSAADWFFSQPEFAVRGGRLTWTDELHGRPPVRFTGVDLVVRRSGRSHALRLDASPPPDWGERFSLRGRFQEPALARRALDAARGGLSGGGDASLRVHPGDWRRWRGTVYAELPGFDVTPIRSPVDLPVGLERGRAALRGWFEVRDGALASATLDAALRDVRLRLGPAEPPIEVSRVDGRFVGRHAKDGGELRIQRLTVQALDAAPAPLGDARVAWHRAADGTLAGGELVASRIDLAFAAALLARMPPAWLSEGLRPQVARLAPRGVASQVEARWDAPAGGPRRYRVAAELRGLALSAEGAGEDEGSAWYAGIHRPSDTLGRPGVEGLDVDLLATDAGGHARLALRNGALELPGVFEAPRVALDRLDAEVEWKIQPGAADAPPRVELRTRGARLANPDAEGRFDAVWSTGATRADGSGRYPGVLDLTGQLTRAPAARIARYLPLGVGAEARRYVEQAVLAGRAPSIDFRVRGDLHDFPFAVGGAAPGAAPNGEFRIATRLEGVRLNAQPQPERLPDGTLRHWPPFDDVSGELVFDRLSMELRNVQGRLAGVGSGGWRVGMRGGIRDLARQPTLTLEGSGRGPLDDGLRFLGQSPVGVWLGGALDSAAPPSCSWR